MDIKIPKPKPVIITIQMIFKEEIRPKLGIFNLTVDIISLAEHNFFQKCLYNIKKMKVLKTF